MTKSRFAFLLLATCALAEPPKLRLSSDVRPVRYRLDLTIVPQQDTFTGKIEIDLEVGKPTDVVWLNARGLTVDAAEVTAGGHTMQAKRRPAARNSWDSRPNRRSRLAPRNCVSSITAHS